jgi:branched-chain amino acid transport system substrate-binding protein
VISFRPIVGAAIGAILSAVIAAPASAQPSGQPIRIGGTLSLTGPHSATALIHKIAGEIYVEQLNKKGGLLGRPVEWVLKDDQSRAELSRTIYEQLVTVDKVDLLIGPYSTGIIPAAIGVAQRYGKVMVHHTLGIPSLAKYDMQFPTWSVGPNPEMTIPTMVLDALGSLPKPPKTIAIVASKHPSVLLTSAGARQVAKSRGLQEVLYLDWEFGNRDFGSIASRVKDAKADFVWVGAVGLEGNQLLDAMKNIDYAPPLHFYLYPSPGPLAKSPEGRNALAASIFEEHPPFTDDPVAAEFVKLFNARAAKAGLPDTAVETQAAASYSAWQVLEAAVNATRSLDDKAIAAWLKANKVKTIEGELRFDKLNNFGDDLMKVKQVQNGRWVTVWPKQWAAPGVKIITE